MSPLALKGTLEGAPSLCVLRNFTSTRERREAPRQRSGGVGPARGTPALGAPEHALEDTANGGPREVTGHSERQRRAPSKQLQSWGALCSCGSRKPHITSGILTHEFRRKPSPKGLEPAAVSRPLSGFEDKSRDQLRT